MRRMEEDNVIRKAAKYMRYKSLREEQNLAVKGILSGRDVFVTSSPCARAKDKTHVCMTGHVIECVTSLNTSNSTNTRNVDMSYQMFFFSSLKLRPQRTSGSRD